MRRFTVDQKLKLVEQLHSRYNRNQYDLSNRERILYGKTSEKDYFYPDGIAQDDRFSEASQGASPLPGAFRIRMLLALVLAMGLIVLDKKGSSIAGLSAGQIFDAISTNYEEDLDAWLNDQILDSPEP
ncbi:MAG: hypothetical protein NC417_10660 [Candidatus Gastranaerophilales bacterium]|nr:hypothetical protein [Candidatus Gastranaerophilales bacterium]